MANYSEFLINSLIKKVKEYPRFSKEEIEKFCWMAVHEHKHGVLPSDCLLYTSPSPRDGTSSRMPSSA